MNFLSNESGFTLIEMSIALVITSIIALIAGVIVVSATRDLNRGNQQIRLQQDLSLAGELLTNAIRTSDCDSTWIYSDQTASEEVNSGSCLKVSSLSMFYKDGDDLVVQNDSGVTQILLISCVDTLNFYRETAADSLKCIKFRIALRQNEYTIAADSKVYFRN